MWVSRSRKPLQHFYSLGSEILQEVSDAKYLGIQIDNKLDWNKHISTVAARGQSKLAFLNRNLKGCPKKLRDTAYISLIRSALEYSCSVWRPHKKSNKNKIEKVPHASRLPYKEESQLQIQSQTPPANCNS